MTLEVFDFLGFPELFRKNFIPDLKKLALQFKWALNCIL